MSKKICTGNIISGRPTATPIDDHSGIVDGNTGKIIYKNLSYAGQKNIPVGIVNAAINIIPGIEVQIEPGTEVQAKMTRKTPSEQFSGQKNTFSRGNIIQND